MPDIGYYTLPVLLSFDGIDKQVNSKLGKGLVDVGARGAKSFTKSLTDGVKAGEADVKRALDGYSKLYDKQADSAGKLKVAKAALADLDDKGIKSGARYERVVAAQEKAQRDHNRSLRDARDAYGDYEKAAKSAAKATEDVGGGGFLSKLKGLASSARASGGEAAGGFVDGFGGPVAELGSKGGPIGTALAAAAVVALSAGAIIGTNLLAGIDKEAQADKIQARFGLDDSQIGTFGKAAGESYGQNFGESVQGNIEAAAVALQNGLIPVGADDKTTSDAINKLQTVSTILGVDIPEAARSAGQLVKTGFAADFNQAADLIVAGSQSGLNVSEDWLDTVNEYSTQFRKLGLSGPEALGLLSQAVQGGARDTDVAADALKEFSIRAIDGSKTTVDGFTKIGLNADVMAAKFAAGGQSAHDGLGQVLDGLRNIKDPVEQSRVAVELFGTQAEDLGGALKKFDLSNATQQFSNVAGAAQRASDTAGNNAAGSIESAKRNLELGVNTFQQSLATSLGPYLEDLASWISAHSDDITSFFTTAADAAKFFVGATLNISGQVIIAFGNMAAAIGDTVGFILDGFESLTGAAATVASAFGADGIASDLRAAQTELGGWSDAAHNYGEGVIAFGHAVTDTGNAVATNSQSTAEQLKQNTEAAKGQIDGVRDALAKLPDGKNIDINAIVTFKDPTGVVIPADQLRAPRNFVPAVPGETRLPGVTGGRAKGGVLPGYSPGVDNMLVPMSGGEGVIVPQVMRKLGPDWLATLNSGQGYADGGVVGPDVMAARALAGTPYSQGSRNDCSGEVARVIARTLGVPETGLMTTKNAKEWLTALGFQAGLGGAGQLSVGWYDHGPNPNDGHMAMTLSDGTNAEAGGKNSVFTLGADAAGADSPQFDQHMFLPNLFGEGQAGSAGSFSGSGGGGAGGTAGVGPNGEQGTYAAPDAKAVREADQKVADADQRVREAEAKQTELKADAKDSQKLSAQADVDKAKREAADARTDAAEAKKGKFTAGSKSAGGSSDSPLKDILGIVGGGLKETFGIGSFLPDLADNPNLKSADAALSAFLPLLFGGGGGADSAGAQQTSSLPFGIPDIAVPPPGTAASGVGSGALPGPPPQVNIDASTQIAGNVGWSADETEQRRRRNEQRAIPRIPVGV